MVTLNFNFTRGSERWGGGEGGVRLKYLSVCRNSESCEVMISLEILIRNIVHFHM